MHLNKSPPSASGSPAGHGPTLSPSSWPDGTVPASAPDSWGQDRNWGPEQELGADSSRLDFSEAWMPAAEGGHRGPAWSLLHVAMTAVRGHVGEGILNCMGQGCSVQAMSYGFPDSSGSALEDGRGWKMVVDPAHDPRSALCSFLVPSVHRVIGIGNWVTWVSF